MRKFWKDTCKFVNGCKKQTPINLYIEHKKMSNQKTQLLTCKKTQRAAKWRLFSEKNNHNYNGRRGISQKKMDTRKPVNRQKKLIQKLYLTISFPEHN